MNSASDKMLEASAKAWRAVLLGRVSRDIFLKAWNATWEGPEHLRAHPLRVERHGELTIALIDALRGDSELR